jgi:glutathione S-transferase
VTIFSEAPDPAFIRLSPHGRVPALVDEHGAVFESGAIALYLAERHPEAGLAIPPGDPRRGPFLQWISYLSSTLQPEVLIQFHPEFYFDDPHDQARLRAASLRRLDGVLGTLDAALSPGPYLFGDHLTVCDICLATQAVWPEIYPGSIEDYANLKRMVAQVSARPAVAGVLRRHAEDRAKMG